MPFNKHKLYYIAIMLQLILFVFFYCVKDCKSRGMYSFSDRTNDYLTCANKLDSIFLERKNHSFGQQDKTIEGDETFENKTIEYKPYTIHNKQVNFIDTVKVSYVGKDGVLVITNYPFHKVIVD